MREIEFRAKSLESKRWIYGCYVSYNDHQGIEQNLIYSRNNGNSEWCNKETVGQYTGLKDKNGTKIFEGDILELVKNGLPFVVHWEKENCRFLMYKSILYDLIASKSEVIGNIYDNPELLR